MLYNIQALRAVAAMLVVLVHLQPVLAPAFNNVDMRFGAAGVDLFFVISGFIMIYATACKPVGPVAFMLDRAVRIVPLYWLMTLIYFMLGLLPIAAFSALHASVGDLARSLLFIPYFDKGGYYPIVYVGWTLNCEMFFYLLFAVVLPVPSLGLRVALIGGFLAACVLAGQIAGPTLGMFTLYTQPLMLEFLLGMLLGLAQVRGWKASPALARVLLIGGAMLLVGGNILFTGERLLLSGLPGMAIVAGLLGLEAQGRPLRNSLLHLMGAASYALYLTHPIIVSTMVRVIEALDITHSKMGALAAASIIMVAVCIGGVVAHVTFERPIGGLLRRRIGHRRSTVDTAEGPSSNIMMREEALDAATS